MRIRGVLEEIIFQNQENHYLVGILSHDGVYTTVVGNGYGVKVGDQLELEGEFTVHEIYGEQFKFTSFVMILPTSREAIVRFLASGAVKGIGPVTAGKIVDRFGEETLEIINYNPDQLLKVSGIGKGKLQQIVASYGEVVMNRETMMFLQSLDIGPALLNRIIKRYGNRAQELILRNPYRLFDEVEGIGFLRADAIAEKLGIDKDSDFRIRSYLRHHLAVEGNNGHAYLDRTVFTEVVSGVLGIDLARIESEIEHLIMEGQLIADPQHPDRIYLERIYFAETHVAGKLMALKSFNSDRDVNHRMVEAQLDDFEKNSHMVLNDLQRQAVKSAIGSKVTVITGGPGTGKTTIVNAIIALLEPHDFKILLTAPTGRAAKRMEESTGHKAQTIHRLLEYQFIEDQGILSFNRNEEDPLKGDLLIVDEFSMIDITLLDHLLEAVRVDMRLVIIGDVDQLPSIGPGNVLKDIIESGLFDTIRLTEIYRQGEDSQIILNAHRINQGRMPLGNDPKGDFFYLGETDQRKIQQQIVHLVTQRLPDYYQFDPLKEIQVIAPIKNGQIGTRRLNEVIQERLNPPSEEKLEVVFQSRRFREGDRVMQLKNNYNLHWIDVDTLLKGEGVFNGEIGFIQHIDPVKKTVRVLFDDTKEVDFLYPELKDLDLSYAITIHKAQGSEFRCIVMPISFIPPKMLSRNLLYTAVTRGKDLVVIVGDSRYLGQMIQTADTRQRNSGLVEQLEKFMTEGETFR